MYYYSSSCTLATTMEATLLSHGIYPVVPGIFVCVVFGYVLMLVTIILIFFLYSEHDMRQVYHNSWTLVVS